MTFNDIRVITEERMFGTGGVNYYPTSITDNSDNLNLSIIVNELTDNEVPRIRTAALALDGSYVQQGLYEIYIDGDGREFPVATTFVVMSIHDIANKATTFKGRNSVSSGFIRFRIVLKASDGSATNPRLVAGLIADAIDRRFGFEAGSQTSDARYTGGEVGGTLTTSKGSLRRVEDTGSAQTYNLDFQYDYLK